VRIREGLEGSASADAEDGVLEPIPMASERMMTSVRPGFW